LYCTVSGCDSVCLGLAIGLVLGFLLVAVVVVLVVFYWKKRRKSAKQPYEGPHVSNILVTPEKVDDTSQYDYINPIGVDDSLPTDSIRLAETKGQKDIESQYITVNTSPRVSDANEDRTCYI